MRHLWIPLHALYARYFPLTEQLTFAATRPWSVSQSATLNLRHLLYSNAISYQEMRGLSLCDSSNQEKYRWAYECFGGWK